MDINSLKMTSQMLAVIIKKSGASYSDLISELSIPEYDQRSKPILKKSISLLKKCTMLKKSGEAKKMTFVAKNPNKLPSGNLLLNIYNQIETKVIGKSTLPMPLAKLILIKLYEAGEKGIESDELREELSYADDDEYISALERALDVKSINIKDEDDQYIFDGDPIAMLSLVNDELNILTEDIDVLEESDVKKVKFTELSDEDKGAVIVHILSNIPGTEKTDISRNYIARKYSRSPDVKYLGRQILINLIELMREQGLITSIENKSGKREFLYLTQEGKDKLKSLKG